MTSSNNPVVPQAREALDKFKMEAAREVGVNLKQGYNGDLTSREAGSVGGQMVKKMIDAYENSIKYAPLLLGNDKERAGNRPRALFLSFPQHQHILRRNRQMIRYARICMFTNFPPDFFRRCAGRAKQDIPLKRPLRTAAVLNRNQIWGGGSRRRKK